ncbi:hypothetical protein VCR12J2_1380081 [Vibrio coralliirubri]|nr:hypothetical protein VCR12J2_1380081 [Vibrio coralliirubri]
MFQAFKWLSTARECRVARDTAVIANRNLYRTADERQTTIQVQAFATLSHTTFESRCPVEESRKARNQIHH